MDDLLQRERFGAGAQGREAAGRFTDLTRGIRSVGRCPGGAMRSSASGSATPTASAPRLLQ